MAKKKRRAAQLEAETPEGSGNAVEASGSESTDYRSGIRVNFEAVCFAVIITLFCRAFVAAPFKIPTGSMEPTLLIGDHLIVNRMIYSPQEEADSAPLYRDVRRGDVVIFYSMTERGKRLVKRVIGMSGEEIAIRDRQIVIDGKPLDEPYAFYASGPESGGDSMTDTMAATKIPQGHVFVMGDNRDNSYDSRFWGTLPIDQIHGRALFIYWSFDASTEAYLATGWRRVWELLKVVTQFFGKTRWDRTFQTIEQSSV